MCFKEEQYISRKEEVLQLSFFESLLYLRMNKIFNEWETGNMLERVGYLPSQTDCNLQVYTDVSIITCITYTGASYQLLLQTSLCKRSDDCN